MMNIEQNGFAEDVLLVYISGYHLLLSLETHAALVLQVHQRKLYLAQSCHSGNPFNPGSATKLV